MTSLHRPRATCCSSCTPLGTSRTSLRSCSIQAGITGNALGKRTFKYNGGIICIRKPALCWSEGLLRLCEGCGCTREWNLRWVLAMILVSFTARCGSRGPRGRHRKVSLRSPLALLPLSLMSSWVSRRPRWSFGTASAHWDWCLGDTAKRAPWRRVWSAALRHEAGDQGPDMDPNLAGQTVLEYKAVAILRTS